MYDLHRLGWSSFQELCITIAREILGQTVQSFLDSNDAGRDGAFTGSWTPEKGQNLSGTFVIQCKFSSQSGARLTKSNMAGEMPKVKKLVADGLCDIYVLISNAGISGAQEAKIKSDLSFVGVKHVLILGVTWIEAQIKENTRLRTLVPRLYGLGDLSQILDERAYTQARAVLESMREDLSKVVITKTYKKAIEALNKHGFVLLIGEPAAGKTTIASMLAMSAADQWKSSVLKLDDPAKVVGHWNPDEPSQFFWIDDVFGVTQYESPLVHGWNHSFSQVKAMLRQGVKIVMSSRDYIYNSARKDLKDSAFPLLNESQVVIDLQELTETEKQQILYNHLKLGKQNVAFLTNIKPYLEVIARHPRFIPETARRIADPFFTKQLYLSEYQLIEFVDKREQLLLEVIQGLDQHSKAALGLIYMRKDHLESPIALQGTELQALERLSSTLGDCIKALEALNGSLVTQMLVDDQAVWKFKHPTIGDAYATTLSLSPDLLDILLSGSSTDNLITQVTCGNVNIEKAVVVPKSHYLMMINRLLEYSSSDRYKVSWISSWGARWALYRFLAGRCSKDFLALYLEHDPNILIKISEPGLSLSFSSDVELAIRLHEFNLLPEINRKKLVETVSCYAVNGEDGRALDDNRLRSLFSDSELEDLTERVRKELLPNLAYVRIKLQETYAASERTPEEHIEELHDLFDALNKLFVNDIVVSDRVKRQTELANDWIKEVESPEPEFPSRILESGKTTERKHSLRSIFDDIDDENE